MGNTVTAISTQLTPSALWEVVGNAMPIVIPITLFAFGFYIVRRVIKVRRLKNGGM